MILTCSMLIVTPRIGEEEFQRVLDQVESDSTGLQIVTEVVLPVRRVLLLFRSSRFRIRR